MWHNDKFDDLLDCFSDKDLNKLGNAISKLTIIPSEFCSIEINKERVEKCLEKIRQELSTRDYYRKVRKAVSKGETTIPKDRWGVHSSHCCVNMGCKYGNEDCPVTMKLVKQEYQCEFCDESESKSCEFKSK